MRVLGWGFMVWGEGGCFDEMGELGEGIFVRLFSVKVIPRSGSRVTQERWLPFSENDDPPSIVVLQLLIFV